MSSRNVILDQLKMYSSPGSSQRKTLVPKARKGSIEIFTEKATGAGAKVFLANEVEEAKNQIKKVLEELDGDIVYSSDKILEDLQIIDIAKTINKVAIEGQLEKKLDYKEIVFESAIGITSCSYAIAETGSVVIEHSNSNERLISLAPETYICILSDEKIFENRYMLADILEEKTEQASAYSIITGVSRTADVAMQVVLGMHGPKNVFIIIYTGEL